MEVIKKAKEITPSTSIIIVMRSINEDTAVDCLISGVVDYVIKENLTRLGSATKSALKETGIKRNNETRGKVKTE